MWDGTSGGSIISQSGCQPQTGQEVTAYYLTNFSQFNLYENEDIFEPEGEGRHACTQIHHCGQTCLSPPHYCISAFRIHISKQTYIALKERDAGFQMTLRGEMNVKVTLFHWNLLDLGRFLSLYVPNLSSAYPQIFHCITILCNFNLYKSFECFRFFLSRIVSFQIISPESNQANYSCVFLVCVFLSH